MKIRGDFVTNSSSVSYILTMKEDIIDIWIRMYGKDSNPGKFYIWIKKKLKKEGREIDIDGEKLYALKVEFDTDDWRYDIPDGDGFLDFLDFLDFLEKKNVGNLSDDELFCYLFHAILNPGLIPYIGATRIETY